jgi:hypothetical protein
MDQQTVTVVNWVLLPLMVPATILLVWKIVNDKLKSNRFSSDLITACLVLGLTGVGVIQLNIDGEVSWLRWALLGAQLLLLVVLYKRVWPPFMHKLRG